MSAKQMIENTDKYLDGNATDEHKVERVISLGSEINYAGHNLNVDDAGLLYRLTQKAKAMFPNYAEILED